MKHIQDGVVAAAGTPAGVLAVLIVGGRIARCHCLFHVFSDEFTGYTSFVFHMVDHTLHNLTHEEGLAFDLVYAENLFAREMHLEIVGEHSGVELCHDDPLIFRKSLD